MSLRDVPRTLERRVAALEARQRAKERIARVEKTDLRRLYGPRGELLMSAAPETPVAIPFPTTLPTGFGTVVFSASPLGDVPGRWVFLPGVSNVPLT